MATIYDAVTLALFAVLVVLALQRSTGPEVAGDRLFFYFPPALGCAAANQLGNTGHPWLAWPLIGIVIGYGWLVLRPFRR